MISFYKHRGLKYLKLPKHFPTLTLLSEWEVQIGAVGEIIDMVIDKRCCTVRRGSHITFVRSFQRELTLVKQPNQHEMAHESTQHVG